MGSFASTNLECFFSIVDTLHALTSSFYYSDTSKLQENVMEMAIDRLSAGLDPEKNVESLYNLMLKSTLN